MDDERLRRPERDLFGPGHFRDFAVTADPLLRRLESEAEMEDIPIVGPAMGKLLYILARASGARRILELGTSIGYSTIWLARALPPRGGTVTTVEWDGPTARRARANLKAARLSGRARVLVGDARGLIKKLRCAPGFDLAFLDVEKEHYSSLLDDAVGLLRPGGLLLFDNTAFRSAGDFLERASGHPGLETLHLYAFFPGHGPDMDALTICLKKG